jgi:tRNA A-37 threonylcarbamoyl transferase component Bud32
MFKLQKTNPDLKELLIYENHISRTLNELLFDNNKPLNEKEMINFVTNIAAGMFHLHKNNINHRDCATRNILWSKSRFPKISVLNFFFVFVFCFCF